MAKVPATTAAEALPPRATAAPVWVAEGTTLVVAEAGVELGTGVLDGLTDADGVTGWDEEATTVCACTTV